MARGVADPERLGVMGGSYGGFMTSWLITQDGRFAAAAPQFPHTNQVSQHLLSNIPHFMAMIMRDHSPVRESTPRTRLLVILAIILASNQTDGVVLGLVLQLTHGGDVESIETLMW